MIAAAMTRGEVHIEGCRPDHVAAVMEKLQSVGAEITPTERGIYVKGSDSVQSVDIETRPFPRLSHGSTGPVHVPHVYRERVEHHPGDHL